MQNDLQRKVSELERVFWSCYNNADGDVQSIFALRIYQHVFNGNMVKECTPFIMQHPRVVELRQKLNEQRAIRKRKALLR